MPYVIVSPAVNGMFRALKKAPVHWQVLLGGQFCITVGIVKHRYDAINEAKELKAAKKQLEREQLEAASGLESDKDSSVQTTTKA